MQSVLLQDPLPDDRAWIGNWEDCSGHDGDCTRLANLVPDHAQAPDIPASLQEYLPDDQVNGKIVGKVTVEHVSGILASLHAPFRVDQGCKASGKMRGLNMFDRYRVPRRFLHSQRPCLDV